MDMIIKFGNYGDPITNFEIMGTQLKICVNYKD